MLTRLIVVILLQHTQISNHYIVYLKIIQCFMSITPQKMALPGASLVAQWLRICLPMQEARVRALVWEDPTCHGATRPVSHNY